MSEKTLRICHLYPDLLNLYGDRGNVLCMRKRLGWRGIDANVEEVSIGQKLEASKYDLLFIGGGTWYNIFPALRKEARHGSRPSQAHRLQSEGLS